MKTKKKMLGIILVGLFVIALVPMAMFASNQGGQPESRAAVCSAYVDVDNDGLCDHYDGNSGHHGLGRVAMVASGQSDGQPEERPAVCSAYIDANNDGLCDHCNENRSHCGNHSGHHSEGRHGGGHHGYGHE